MKKKKGGTLPVSVFLALVLLVFQFAIYLPRQLWDSWMKYGIIVLSTGFFLGFCWSVYMQISGKFRYLSVAVECVGAFLSVYFYQRLVYNLSTSDLEFTRKFILLPYLIAIAATALGFAVKKMCIRKKLKCEIIQAEFFFKFLQIMEAALLVIASLILIVEVYMGHWLESDFLITCVLFVICAALCLTLIISRNKR